MCLLEGRLNLAYYTCQAIFQEKRIMIVEYIRYRLEPAQCEDFLAAYGRARAELDASAHCLGYELSRCVKEPERFMLRIEWDSPEGHLEGFRKSPGFQPFLAEIRPYIAQIEEMTHYALTGIQADKRAAV